MHKLGRAVFILGDEFVPCIHILHRIRTAVVLAVNAAVRPIEVLGEAAAGILSDAPPIFFVDVACSGPVIHLNDSVFRIVGVCVRPIRVMLPAASYWYPACSLLFVPTAAEKLKQVPAVPVWFVVFPQASTVQDIPLHACPEAPCRWSPLPRPRWLLDERRAQYTFHCS
jgi:hypothetical protein